LPHKIKDPFASCPIEKWIANSEQWNIEHYDLVKNKLIERHPELKEQIHELD